MEICSDQNDQLKVVATLPSTYCLQATAHRMGADRNNDRAREERNGDDDSKMAR